jgi:hypothetical protein
MPRSCTICAHRDVRRINAAIVESMPNRRIATQYGISEAAVRRHKAEHLPRRMVKAKEAKSVLDADQLLTQAQSLYAKAVALLRQAEQDGDVRTALAGIGQARQCLELLMEATGKLDRTPRVNVLISPEWIAVRTAIMDALSRHPEARQDVVQALARVDGHHARD